MSLLTLFFPWLRRSTESDTRSAIPVKIFVRPFKSFSLSSESAPYDVYSTIRNYDAIYSNNTIDFTSANKNFNFMHDYQLRKRYG